MNDRQLRSFVNAAELNSFTKAANLSFISTPALINQINTLERDINISLFNRNTHGIELTPEGRMFFDAAKKILALYDETMENCAATDKQKCRIGCPADFTADIADWIFEYQQNHPDLQLQMDDMTDMTLDDKFRALHDGLYSMIFLSDSAENFSEKYLSEEYIYQPITEKKYYITVPKTHPLAALDHITASDLQNYEVYTTPAPSGRKGGKETLNDLGIRTRTLNLSGNYGTDLTNRLNLLLKDAVLLTTDISPVGITIPTDIPAGTIGYISLR